MIEFLHPEMFLLLLLPFIVRGLVSPLKGLHGDALRIPFLKDLRSINIKSKNTWRKTDADMDKVSLPLFVLLGIYFLLTVAAARPQYIGEPLRAKNYGRDILLVVDISTSMLEPDFTLNGRRTNRINAVKQVVGEFVEKRRGDRVGLIVFGSRAYLQSPITFDKKSLTEILYNIDAGMAGNSTAIGDALGLALKSFKKSQDKTDKVIVLLTDGENNDGMVTLPQAINLAKQENIKIYTIGAGAEASIMQSILKSRFGIASDLDEESLKKIASETKASYFKAESTEDLLSVYNQINKLEPSVYNDNTVREIRDWFYIPLSAALALSIFLFFLIRRAK